MTTPGRTISLDSFELQALCNAHLDAIRDGVEELITAKSVGNQELAQEAEDGINYSWERLDVLMNELGEQLTAEAVEEEEPQNN